ncbi:MAG: PAS domain S-box protein, partial [Candidatus Sulfotelmatobacter sp.]
VEYLKRGASDYVLKNRLELLPIAIAQTLHEKRHRDAATLLQERILAAKKEWEFTFDSVPDAILILDDKHLVHRANRAATEVLSLPFSKLIGRPCYEVLHGMDKVHPDCPHDKMVNSGLSQRGDFEETRLGKTFDVTSTPLKDTNGNFVGCIHVLRDISDRNRAEQALRHSEERYRSLVAATSQVVWSADPTGKIVEDSPKWREFTGGPGVLEAIHPDDRSRVMQEWSKAVKNRSAYHTECKGRRKDGEYRDLLVSGVPILEKNGRIREWVGTCTDITDQRQLEEQFRQAQKMEAMGRLAGGIAHDFNNLLGVIIGYSDLLLAALDSDVSSHTKAQEIKNAGQRAASLTTQLLAFSRKQVLSPRVLNVNTVVNETSKLLTRVLGEDIELTTRLAPELAHIKADPAQIEQVIMNLAINARDAMPNGGNLVIETSNAELDHQVVQQAQPGHYVLLSIIDTGSGMDKATLSRIFEPFFTTKEVGKGTGLGLATVYGIVQQSGGYIWVSSEVGKGATFNIYLPAVEEKIEEVAAESTVTFPMGAETILLVEDEPSLRELSRQLLASMGYTVVAAASPAEAIRISSRWRGPIHLLLTDVVMPGMNGRELADLLSATYPKMKVLYVSGHPDSVVVEYALVKPGVAFLQRPFTRDALAKKINEVLGSAADRSRNHPGGTR